MLSNMERTSPADPNQESGAPNAAGGVPNPVPEVLEYSQRFINKYEAPAENATNQGGKEGNKPRPSRSLQNLITDKKGDILQ